MDPDNYLILRSSWSVKIVGWLLELMIVHPWTELVHCLYLSVKKNNYFLVRLPNSMAKKAKRQAHVNPDIIDNKSILEVRLKNGRKNVSLFG